jgi:nucleotide-binding universal stress UspA family protein
MEIKKILWPTDLSDNAANALPYVTSLSGKYQAEVHLIFVVEDVHQFDHFYGDARPSFLKEFQERIIRKGEEYLDRICKSSLAGCPLYQKRIVVGDPASEILKYIHERKMDMVIMATHGHGEQAHTGEMRHFPFGSVSEKVMRNSSVPVLVISPSKRTA